MKDVISRGFCGGKTVKKVKINKDVFITFVDGSYLIIENNSTSNFTIKYGATRRVKKLRHFMTRYF